MDINSYWNVVLAQKAKEIKNFFHPEASICWQDTNEKFTVDEFIQANCQYPGEWSGLIKRIEKIDNLIITVTHVWEINEPLEFHVTSFIKVEDNKIVSIDEYWGNIEETPQWRLDLKLGKPINKKINK